jgi:hypothetical protein
VAAYNYSYIFNDIWRNNEPNIRLFLYECVIYKQIRDSSDIYNLQTDINRLGEWGVENEMEINPGKSKTVSFTQAGVKERIRYYFGEQLIPEANNFTHSAWGLLT